MTKLHKKNENSNGAALYFIIKTYAHNVLEDLEDLEDLENLEKEAEYKVEELRQYLCDALRRSGKKASDIDELLGTQGMSGHYFGKSQWMFPTPDAYAQMSTILDLPRDYNACRDACTKLEYIRRLRKIKENQ